MDQMQENQLRVVPGINPVAIVRAYAKARNGCSVSRDWLMEQHRLGNTAATKALDDLERFIPRREDANVA